MASDKMANEHKQSGAPSPGVQDAKPDSAAGDSTRTVIHHNDDGTHMIEHSDGETTGPHMDMAEAMENIMAKHGGGMDPMMDQDKDYGSEKSEAQHVMKGM